MLTILYCKLDIVHHCGQNGKRGRENKLRKGDVDRFWFLSKINQALLKAEKVVLILPERFSKYKSCVRAQTEREERWKWSLLLQFHCRGQFLGFVVRRLTQLSHPCKNCAFLRCIRPLAYYVWHLSNEDGTLIEMFHNSNFVEWIYLSTIRKAFLEIRASFAHLYVYVWLTPW